MTIVLIFVITAAMLLCMAAAYIKNVIIPNAGLEMTAYDLNLTSTILCKDPETGAYKVTQNLYGAENRVWVDIEEIPKNLQNAAVAIEDDEAAGAVLEQAVAHPAEHLIEQLGAQVDGAGIVAQALSGAVGDLSLIHI